MLFFLNYTLINHTIIYTNIQCENLIYSNLLNINSQEDIEKNCGTTESKQTTEIAGSICRSAGTSGIKHRLRYEPIRMQGSRALRATQLLISTKSHILRRLRI